MLYILARSLRRESCLKICPGTNWCGSMIWCWHYMFWGLQSQNQVLSPRMRYVLSFQLHLSLSALWGCHAIKHASFLIVFCTTLFLERYTAFWILLFWMNFILHYWKADRFLEYFFSYWTIWFAERAGADVVECACLIGLPKFKVFRLSTHESDILSKVSIGIWIWYTYCISAS